MSPACRAEMLLTQQLNTGYVYNRPVYFHIRSVNVAGLSGSGVLVFNQDRTASVSGQDGNSTGQDRKCK